MPDGTITVSPNGAETIRVSGSFESTETSDGWRVELLMELPYPDVPSEQVVNEVADLAVGETHYSAHVSEYHPVEGRIVVAGRGPAPV